MVSGGSEAGRWPRRAPRLRQIGVPRVAVHFLPAAFFRKALLRRKVTASQADTNFTDTLSVKSGSMWLTRVPSKSDDRKLVAEPSKCSRKGPRAS